MECPYIKQLIVHLCSLFILLVLGGCLIYGRAYDTSYGVAACVVYGIVGVFCLFSCVTSFFRASQEGEWVVVGNGISDTMTEVV